MSRSRVIGRRGGYSAGNTLELSLSCGHVVYVQPYGRYALAKTVTCIEPGCDGRTTESTTEGSRDE